VLANKIKHPVSYFPYIAAIAIAITITIVGTARQPMHDCRHCQIKSKLESESQLESKLESKLESIKEKANLCTAIVFSSIFAQRHLCYLSGRKESVL
jgi:hypothetical protein